MKRPKSTRRKPPETHVRKAALIVPRKSRRNAAGVSEWRLAVRQPIEAYDDYTETVIELAPGQVDATRIEGLIIDFRYLAADGEFTRRSLLCWQCGRVGERIYVRGYCPFREELRTFRVDRMQDVIAFQNAREVPVGRTREFFSAFAADHIDGDDDVLGLAGRED